MFVSKAAVVGAGTMGGQIAQTIAAAGIPVVLKDIDDALVQAGLDEAANVTRGQVGKLAERGKITAEQADAQAQEILDRIHGTTSYEAFGDVDFVVEAVPERMDIKQSVFAELDAATPGHAILASNTSSLSITEIGEATLRPERVVGFHYFYPASIMPLIEIVEGEDTSAETVTAAVVFAQAIRKQPITCAEVPGFVVNRILNSGIAEVWREQEEKGLSIKKIDEGVGAAGVTPVGPYYLVNLLGLDTVLHVAEHLVESYGEERFYVPKGMQKLVADGKLGAKTGGDGFYDPAGEPNISGDGDPDVAELVELLSLKTLLEACLVLEERVATTPRHRLRDDGRRGAGPAAGADATVHEGRRRRPRRDPRAHGERGRAPRRALRAADDPAPPRRPGPARRQKTGQGFYPYPQPDAEQPAEVIKLESRGDGVTIAWLANGPMNSISPQVVEDLAKVWATVKENGTHALVFASTNPMLFSAGADIKAFTTMDEAAGRTLLDDTHGLLREMERSGIVTIAAVNGLAFGGGNELAMACDVRIAARSALFGQPEIKLGIIPGFGGTQRLPRLVGTNKALEMNLVGDPILAEEAFELGLVNRVVEDHELLDTALMWAHRLAGQAPLAVAEIKSVSGNGDLDAGIAAEKEGFAAAFASEDAKEGISAFLGKRAPQFKGS